MTYHEEFSSVSLLFEVLILWTALKCWNTKGGKKTNQKTRNETFAEEVWRVFGAILFFSSGDKSVWVNPANGFKGKREGGMFCFVFLVSIWVRERSRTGMKLGMEVLMDNCTTRPVLVALRLLLSSAGSRPRRPVVSARRRRRRRLGV